MSTADNDGHGLTTQNVMISMARITMAGFGGALVGMSFARRGMSSSPAASLARKRLSSELPNAWAMACMTFVGLIEASRIMSPTSLVLEIGQLDPTATSSQAIRTIGDFTLGGAVAGAAFRGLPSQKRTPPIGGGGSKPLRLAGRIGPGLALGLVAGILQFGSDYTEQLAKSQKEDYGQEESEQEDDYVLVDEPEKDLSTEQK